MKQRNLAETQAETQSAKAPAIFLIPSVEHQVVEKHAESVWEKNEKQTESSISYRMLHWKFSPEQRKELKRALDMRIPKKYILSYAYPENSVIKMMQYRKAYEKKMDIS